MAMIDKIALIYIENKKVLGTISKGKDKVYFPGGKREGNETDLQALTREIKEELSVDVVDTSVKFYGEFKAQAHGKPEGVFVQMRCYQAAFIGNLQPDHEIDQLVWLTSKDKDRASGVVQIILDDLHQRGLIE